MKKAYTEQVSASLMLLVPMLMWGSSFVAMKVAITAYDPLVMVFGRMIVALVALIPFWPRLIREAKQLSRQDLKWIGLMSLSEPCLYFIFEGYAVQYTSASQAGMILGLSPLAVIGAARIFLGEKPASHVWIGFALAVVGMFFLSYGASASESAPNPVVGNILELCAVLCGAVYVLFAKQLSPGCPPLLITALQSLLGAFFFFPLLALPAVTLPQAFPALPTVAVIYMGAGVTLLSFVFYNHAIRKVPAATTGAFLNLVPLISLFMGVFWLGETLNPGQWLACGLVLSGVIFSQWKRNERLDSSVEESVDS